jgi:hypothetical protein
LGRSHIPTVFRKLPPCVFSISSSRCFVAMVSCCPFSWTLVSVLLLYIIRGMMLSSV